MDMVKNGIQWVGGTSVMLSERSHTAVVGDKMNSGVAEGRKSDMGAVAEEWGRSFSLPRENEEDLPRQRGRRARRAQTNKARDRRTIARSDVWSDMTTGEPVQSSELYGSAGRLIRNMEERPMTHLTYPLTTEVFNQCQTTADSTFIELWSFRAS